MQNFKKTKKIFLVGIGGIGVSALAKLFSAQGGPASGWKVSGSDKYSSEITEDLKNQGIKIYIGHREENLDSDVDLVIYSAAVGSEIPERKKAARLRIKQLSYPEALGLITKGKDTIAISGTHGKSTTTAMLGLILTDAGLDPTVIVGSKVKHPSFDENVRAGKSKYFVVEACEWRAHMLNLKPKIIILTNIEPDHLDYYKTFKNLKNAFKEYVGKLPKNGLLIFNADDKNCIEAAKSARCKTVGYSIKSGFDFSLQIPGRFNIYNALAASTCALRLGIKPATIRKTLANFKGIWRRFEKIGEHKGALIFSDYAHHPTAVRETLMAAKEKYPQRRLVVAYQPHHFDRTKRLFQEFTKAFDSADLVILNEIYDVPGRESVKQISSGDLVKELKKRKIKAVFARDLKETKKFLLKNIKRGDLVLIMGAGDIYKLKI
jgi:UDP-N-acetylmuramate--alanine ligase